MSRNKKKNILISAVGGGGFGEQTLKSLLLAKTQISNYLLLIQTQIARNFSLFAILV